MVHERMFTWCSDEHLGDVAQQPGPVERLDLDRHHVRGRLVVVPLDLDEPLGLVRRAPAALAQSVRCTDTPRPRVTKPMISSPGTGVQHRDRRTITSSSPSTCTPTVAPLRRRGRARRAVRW